MKKILLVSGFLLSFGGFAFADSFQIDKFYDKYDLGIQGFVEENVSLHCNKVSLDNEELKTWAYTNLVNETDESLFEVIVSIDRFRDYSDEISLEVRKLDDGFELLNVTSEDISCSLE
jgi:hypothetical protein